MRALDRKLARDLWRLRAQVLTIALVMACGVASLVSMRSAYDSLHASRDGWYVRARFADVFTSVRTRRVVRAVERFLGVQWRAHLRREPGDRPDPTSTPGPAVDDLQPSPAE